MSALRIVGQVTTHATSRHVDFLSYANTACGLRVYWKIAMADTVGLYPDDQLIIAERVDEPVDCMTCLVRVGQEQELEYSLTNPCAEI